MADGSPPGAAPVERSFDERLDSWKEIAAYLKRDVKTVQRWEKREGMPVHRHVHDKMGSVYAFRTDLDAWAQHRRPVAADEPQAGSALAPDSESTPGGRQRPRLGRVIGGAGAVVAAATLVWQVASRERFPDNPLVGARYRLLTEFDGIEQAAAISRDGRFVAFLSDRDGSMDVWVTQVGMGQFYNLTQGRMPDLVNASVRTVGFSPDGALVTFWARLPDGANLPAISVWAVPVLGGRPRPYVEGAAELDWSADAARQVYHTPGPGDPMYVRDARQPRDARRILSAPPGLHSHFPTWSPDQAFVYFVQGVVPDRMDIWRIRPSGGTPERITHHGSLVSHPVFLNASTLLYLASDPDGSGPWIYSLDVGRRASRRVSVGIDRYTSLAASSDGRRLVATLASPKGTFWRVPITEAGADMTAARRIPLTTGSGSSPRLGSTFLLYVSSRGAGDSIWKLEGDTATELWNAPDARVVGGPAIARDERRMAFSARQNGRTWLYVARIDGTDAHVVATSLEPQGSPAWAPDGRSVTVAAVVDGVPRLVNVPVDGRPPVRLSSEHAVDPVWSPDGDIVVFSGADIGATFRVKGVTADGRGYSLPDLTLTRGARRLSFMPGQRALVVLRGGIGHKNLWLIDLDTGAERQLTDFAPGFAVRDFSVAPDGRELVLEQVEEQSDVVLIDLPRP